MNNHHAHWNKHNDHTHIDSSQSATCRSRSACTIVSEIVSARPMISLIYRHSLLFLLLWILQVAPCRLFCLSHDEEKLSLHLTVQAPCWNVLHCQQHPNRSVLHNWEKYLIVVNPLFLCPFATSHALNIDVLFSSSTSFFQIKQLPSEIWVSDLLSWSRITLALGSPGLFGEISTLSETQGTHSKSEDSQPLFDTNCWKTN